MLDQHVNDIHDGRVHVRRLQIARTDDVQVSERLSQFLRLFHVHSHEFQYTVLRHHRHDHGALSFVIEVDQGNTAGTGLQHAPTGLVQRAVGMNR